jgi:TatD DNase family protein
MIIDTHSHLYLEEFNSDIDQIILRSKQSGVEKIYLPAIDSQTTQQLIQLEIKYPSYCIAMMGLHPCYVKENYKAELEKVSSLLQQRKCAAIGECGLDFYWDKTFEKEQYEALEQQIEWALEYQLPIVLHTRNATQETIDVIKKYADKGLKGIFHCFGGSSDEANQIIETGFYLGIGGVITYKNSGLDKVINEIDLKHIVLETDSPYLTPVPNRGKRNETSFLKIIAEKIAEIKNCSYEEVANATTQNALSLFN